MCCIEAPESHKYYGGYDPAEYFPNYDDDDYDDDDDDNGEGEE